ncbi:kinesin-related protein 4 isoform X2 [Calliphora vicina]|uniref:kinesin-related protein 4 isoform X2 n=1 Tax=Calliphora vicina TaxID=7373 RepID=UPI00325B11DE
MATSSSSTSSSSRLGSASPSTSVICQEVFDDSCQPSEDEINDYALLVGIDPVKETHLLYLAKEGLMQALPDDWKICYSEEKSGHYYYNLKTKTSQWEHPLDDVYRNLVEQARQKHHHNALQTQNTNATNVIISAIINTTTSIAPTTNVVDNSDDASQLDSGIRSLQGTDECDNTTNTLEMSSPSTTQMSQGAIPKQSNSMGGNGSGCGGGGGGGSLTTNNSSSSSTTPSGFSGGVNRFLESRTKNFGSTFMPVKNTRFEVTKTNPQLGFNMRLANDNLLQKFPLANRPETEAQNHLEKKGFTLSGTGAMFLKSRRQLEVGLNQASAIITNPHNIMCNSSSVIVEGIAGTPPGVKGILRDSSLTDMRRRLDKDNHHEDTVEDKKRVHFNLEDCSKLRHSPEEDPSSSRKLTQSPEVSANSDDDAEDDDPWDDDDEDGEELNDCVGIGSLPLDGAAYQRSLNPFLINDEKHLKEVKIIPVSKTQTIQMLKAQSFSMDLPDREKAKVTDLTRSQSVEHTQTSNASAVQYLDKLKETPTVKPLYEDTDSDSKGSSVRSFIINKSEQDSLHSAGPSNNPFDLDELGRKHSREVEQLEMKLQSVNSEKSCARSLKVASKLVSFLKKDNDKISEKPKDEPAEKTPDIIQEKMENEKQLWLKEERERLEEQLQNEIDLIKKEHEQKLKNIRHEYDLRLTSHRHQMEEAIELQFEEIRHQLEEELDNKRKAVVDEHKAQMCTLQKNHAEILEDLERDLKSEEEILKKEHALKLNEMKAKLNDELELERQRMRDNGEDRLYEKVRCEKRLLEDKYRCLKEKYIRLKTDVKLSLERRNRRREAQALQQQSLHTCTTGSETERSISNKPSIGNSDNRSLSYSTSCQNSVGVSTNTAGKNIKPPLPPKTHLHPPSKDQLHQQQQHHSDRSTEKGAAPATRKPGIASKYIKHLQAQDDTTSMSQSDTTISNNYSKGRYLPAPQPILSDNGNSDSEAFQSNQENNNNSRGGGGGVQRKKQFSRQKSASTSRLNNSENFKTERPCTPVENLRHQLQKLEDLEDQFPENTLDATYHLRYPFSDISNADYAAAGAASSELEFFKHRIHLERDSVRRAKESLRTQRTNFRARQREIKQRHKAMVSRHSLDQLIQEEKELTEMEVNLHRTRALLGEKVIRLRHLEQSLLRIYEKEKPTMDLLGVEPKEDATLSDLSSHSSSGFSSTDFASGDTQNLNKRKDLYQLESNDCIKNLEILNAEIREILDLLGKTGQHGALSAPMISPSELNWSHMLSSGPVAANNPPSAHSIPTLADRLETYRQLATGRMQNSMIAANTIVSQNPRAVSYTTSLVERTRDLRNWLRQAKNEHELLSSMTLGVMTGVHPSAQLTANTAMGASGSGAGGGGGPQTNL